MNPGPGGIEGILNMGKLIVRRIRADRRYEVVVWPRDQFPFGMPAHAEVVSNRDAAVLRARELVTEIAQGSAP